MVGKAQLDDWTIDDKDIMNGGYTDQKWRAECEAKARKLAEERVEQRRFEMALEEVRRVSEAEERYQEQQRANRKATNALRKANTRQIGGDHYKNMGVEVWDVVDTWPIEQRIGAYRIGLLKYTMRMGSKDENMQEIQKAEHYAQKLIEVLEERDNGYEK